MMRWCSVLSSLSLHLKVCRHGYKQLSTSILLRQVSMNFNHECRKTAWQTAEKLLVSSSPKVSFVATRYYSKNKDRKKGDKGKKKVVAVNEQLLSEVINIESMKDQMKKSVEDMKDDYMRNLSLRSTVGTIDTLSVSFEGKELTLQELAQIGRKNPKTIILAMHTFPQAIPAVLQAIQKSGLNLNPQQDGTTIFIPVPKVTKEHRETLAKNAKALFVKYKDSIRDIQNKYLRQVKKDTDISEDLSHAVQDQIIAFGHQYVSEMELILESKQNELLGKN